MVVPIRAESWIRTCKAANFAEAAPEGNGADWTGLGQAASPGSSASPIRMAAAPWAGEPECEREARLEPLRITILCPVWNEETVIELLLSR